MNSINANNLARLKNRMWIAALLVLVTATLAAPRSTAQAMQRGISVELVPSSSAVPVPDADNQDALIITVTETGKIYFGVDQVTSESLGKTFKTQSQRTQSLYIKADARATYASVVKVLDAAHAASLSDITLLTTQGKTTQPGKVVAPEGIEIELARHPSTGKE